MRKFSLPILLVIALLTLPASTRSQTAKPIWRGTSGGYEIIWTRSNLTANPVGNKNRAELSALELTKAEKCEIDAKNICETERKFRLLSVVGSLVGLSDKYYCGCQREAHPTYYQRYTSIDLAKPGKVYAVAEDRSTPTKQVQLTDYFAADDVYRALLADPYVQKALKENKEAQPAKNLAELVKALAEDGCRTGFDSDMLSRFVFHHLEGDKVAVRLGISNLSAHVCNKELTQLGLLLPIPAALRKPLQAADARQEGFLMKDLKQLAGTQLTLIKLTTGKKTRR